MAPRQQIIDTIVLDGDSSEPESDSEDDDQYSMALEWLEDLIPKFSDPCVRVLDSVSVSQKIARIIRDGLDKLLMIMDVNVPFKSFELDGQLLTRLCQLVTRQADIPDEPVVGCGKGGSPRSFFEACCTGFDICDVDHDYLVKIAQDAGLTKDKLTKIVENGWQLLEVKSGLFEMLVSLERRVKILIPSADPLGDLYEALYRAHGFSAAKNSLVTDAFSYDETGKIVGRSLHWLEIQSALADGTNPSSIFPTSSLQNAIVISQDEEFKDIPRMALDNPKVVLTIGLLTERVEERLEKYLETFDIVLVRDETMDLPRLLINTIKWSVVQDDEEVHEVIIE